MTNQTDNFPDLMSDDSFEVVMRGYSRRQVHDYMVRTRNQIRDLEERLARTIDQAEQSRLELAEARRKLTESPQNPDELGERLSQILKLAHEEAAANKQASETEATRLRDNAVAEAERLVASAREQADAIRVAAQEEVERRIADATATADRLLAQAGADAEEALGTARAEAEETRQSARAEADRVLGEARSRADAILGAAQQRVAALDEHTGRRVAQLTDTHTEVVRRLTEIGSVVGGLMQWEAAAGPLIDEAVVLPPAPYQPYPQQAHQSGRPAAPEEAQPSSEPVTRAENAMNEQDHGAAVEDLDLRMIVEDTRPGEQTSVPSESMIAGSMVESGIMESEMTEDTDVDFGRVRRQSDEQEPMRG
ncbi:hypothetical protein [Sphaerimonospora thailandensis]|uniref:DivIVA protein n=1 Tax=Sphaerimonospora thailandensis TaxID=795644 RepID=A0A8J3RA74_9ACTN|nr:hypothetical protein [Sphaerimonospora thailandensis]GIH70874.1 hypothetical protein Mth01_31270 [Sphaerimonospora thailandensis]